MNIIIYGPFMDIYVILPSEKSDYSVVEKKVVRMPSDLSDYSVVLNEIAEKEESPTTVMIVGDSLWCPGRDSNPHTSRHTHLKRARLPIPPPGRVALRNSFCV